MDLAQWSSLEQRGDPKERWAVQILGLVGRHKLLARGELFSARETKGDKPEGVLLERGSCATATTRGGDGVVGPGPEQDSPRLPGMHLCSLTPSLHRAILSGPIQVPGGWRRGG